MLYAMVRAIIQDLRATAFQKSEDMDAAYDLAMAQPSQKSLRYCEYPSLYSDWISMQLQFTSYSKASFV
jgi:hypothetical protein